MNKNTYIKIGTITSLIIFGLFWGVNFLKGKGVFDNTKIFYVVYDRIDGLGVSNPVLVNGFEVGQVRDISFLPDTSGRLIVEISIENNYRIPGKSVARIFSSDLMGTKAIDLIFGKESYLQEAGDTLIGDFEGSLQEMVSVQMLPLKNKAEDLMKQMEEAIAIVNYVFNEETRDDIMASFKNIKKTFDNLENSSSNLDSIVNGGKNKMASILSNVESITKNLSENNQLITSTLNSVSSITDSIANSDLKQAINEAHLVMSQLNDITTKINNSEGSLGLLLNNDTLYQNIEDVTYSLNILLEDVHKNPKRYVHFSAFNTGKTVYVEENESSNKSKKQKITYSILIMQSNKTIPLNSEKFKGHKNINEVMIDNLFSYLLGNKKNRDSANTFLTEIKGDFIDAKVVEIKNGKYAILN